jgi:hypothetical protein
MNAPLCRIGFTPGDTLSTLRKKIFETDGMPTDYAFSLKQGMTKENAIFAHSVEEWVTLDELSEVVLMLPHSAAYTAPKKSAERGLFTSVTAPELSRSLRPNSSSRPLRSNHFPLPPHGIGKPWEDGASSSMYSKEGAASVITQEVQASNQTTDLDLMASIRNQERAKMKAKDAEEAEFGSSTKEQQPEADQNHWPLVDLSEAADAVQDEDESDKRWPYSKPVVDQVVAGSPTGKAFGGPAPSIGEALEIKRTKVENEELVRTRRKRGASARRKNPNSYANMEDTGGEIDQQEEGVVEREQKETNRQRQHRLKEEAEERPAQPESEEFDTSGITPARRLLLASADDLLDVFCDAQVQSAYAISLVELEEELEEEEEEEESATGAESRSVEEAQTQADELFRQEQTYYKCRLETLCSAAVYEAVKEATSARYAEGNSRYELVSSTEA